jgi:mRNA interferase MazF
LVIAHGDIAWVDLGPMVGSTPGRRRPVVVIQSDEYNRSRISTAIVAGITSNTRLAELPGNVFLPAGACGLKRDSAINVSQISTVDRAVLSDPIGRVPGYLMNELGSGLKRILGL